MLCEPLNIHDDTHSRQEQPIYCTIMWSYKRVHVFDWLCIDDHWNIIQANPHHIVYTIGAAIFEPLRVEPTEGTWMTSRLNKRPAKHHATHVAMTTAPEHVVARVGKSSSQFHDSSHYYYGDADYTYEQRNFN